MTASKGNAGIHLNNAAGDDMFSLPAACGLPVETDTAAGTKLIRMGEGFHFS